MRFLEKIQGVQVVAEAADGREALQLIAESHSTKQIASRLNLSVKTVESHRALLMERLGIHDTAGLALFAARAGLVERE